jgi:hypothetical protein
MGIPAKKIPGSYPPVEKAAEKIGYLTQRSPRTQRTRIFSPVVERDGRRKTPRASRMGFVDESLNGETRDER